VDAVTISPQSNSEAALARVGVETIPLVESAPMDVAPAMGPGHHGAAVLVSRPRTICHECSHGLADVTASKR
jgi:hypothetical protein